MGAPPRLNPLSPGGTQRRAEFMANLSTKAKLCTKAYQPGGCTYPGCERYHDPEAHTKFLRTLKREWCPGECQRGRGTVIVCRAVELACINTETYDILSLYEHQ